MLIDGQPYREQRQRVGYVPQRGSVDWDFPTSVLDVVMMGRYGALGWLRRPGSREREAALAALEKVGMADFAERQISQLSGGQQQRVFLARALVQDADVYFMDEPFQGVDATTERAIVGLLKELRGSGQDGGGGAPRPADRARVLRLGDAAQRAARSPAGRWTRSSPRRTCAGPTAGASPSWAVMAAGAGCHRERRPQPARRAQFAHDHRSAMTRRIQENHGITATRPSLFFDYTLRTVALGTAMLGVVSGALGAFAVLRRQSLMGDAISHAALPGVVLAFMLTGIKGPAGADGWARRLPGWPACCW